MYNVIKIEMKGEIKMILKTTKEIEIEEEDIIKEFNLTKQDDYLTVLSCVESYTTGLDDCDYYLIGREEEKQIAENVYQKLQNNINDYTYEDLCLDFDLGYSY